MSQHDPTVLAHGSWTGEQVKHQWLQENYAPPQTDLDHAQEELAKLRARGSPSYDGLSARLVDFHQVNQNLELTIQPIQWSLRLLPDARDSLTVLCVVRTEDGRWLVGRRAAWVATWAGKWTLGAGGAVELGENPVDTLVRELNEEWSLKPQELDIKALIRTPNRLTILIALAWVSGDAQPVLDVEHDEFAWWPAQVTEWPNTAASQVRKIGEMLDPNK